MDWRAAWAGCRARLREGRGDERGTFALILALSIVPTTFLVGAAMDYSGATHLKQHLQTATDGAGLKLCQISGDPTQTELEDAARALLSNYSAPRPFELVSAVRTTNPRQVEIFTRSVYPTAILRAFGVDYSLMPVTASAKCFGEPQSFEIALVLDNTGSMALSGGSESKMASLKTAAATFIDFVYTSPQMKNSTKMAIVPFATSVAVSPTTLNMSSWMDTNGNADHHWNGVSGTRAQATTDGYTSRLTVFDRLKQTKSSWGWAGCFESLPYPLNVQDVKPVSSNKNSYYVPLFSPDEPGDGGVTTTKTAGNVNQYYYNSYVTDSSNDAACGSGGGTAGHSSAAHSARMLRGCKYKNAKGATSVDLVISGQSIGTMGPNFSCTTRPLTRLTDVRSTLDAEITAMQPSGTTNIHEGFMWGWRTLSPNSVLGDGASYTKNYNHKIIILMTDGDNTWIGNSGNTLLKSFHSAFGYYVNADGTTPQGTLKRLSTASSPTTPNPTNDTQATTAMDNLTVEACRNARAAATTGGPEKINIYTIGFSTAAQPIDEASKTMLRNCSGHTDVRKRSFVANNSTELVAVFKEIANDIHNLRLTH